jgi:peptidyl-prolyl cis-trans isomerase-like 4
MCYERGVQIIKDFKTKASLCYAFIEFDQTDDCERAYFKMDNVRGRVKIDFVNLAECAEQSR